MSKTEISSYDIDGVIFLGEGRVSGLTPGKNDLIITGRSFEEAGETYDYLHSRKIYNPVAFNLLRFDQKTRESSGHHKVKVIKQFNRNSPDYRVAIHYEDDPVQVEIIRAANIEGLFVVHVNTNGLINLENKRHWE